jgi:hypothetical protein
MTGTKSRNDFNTFMAAYEKDRKAREKTNLANQYAIIDALDQAGIALVTVTFDGEGDSGQIEDIKAFAHVEADTGTGTDPRPLPNKPVKYCEQSFRDHKSTKLMADKSLAEAIEDLCYALLEQKHCGWENNEGAFGEFTFEVEERRVRLEFDARFTDTVHSKHCF